MLDSDIVYRPPQEYATPLLDITRGCTHNACRFCTMYAEQPFQMRPLEDVEADLAELALCVPEATRLYLTGGNPFALSTERLQERLALIHRYLPKVQEIAMNARIDDVTPKNSVELSALAQAGVTELYIGQESANDATLALVNKGYTANDILRECKRLERAGIAYNSTFLNGVTDRSLSLAHARETALLFNQLQQKMIAITSFTMFPGTPLAEDAEKGRFTPVTERERLEELLCFIETLDVESEIWTSPTSAVRLLGAFPAEKPRMIAELKTALAEIDEAALQTRRENIWHL